MSTVSVSVTAAVAVLSGIVILAFLVLILCILALKLYLAQRAKLRRTAGQYNNHHFHEPIPSLTRNVSAYSEASNTDHIDTLSIGALQSFGHQNDYTHMMFRDSGISDVQDLCLAPVEESNDSDSASDKDTIYPKFTGIHLSPGLVMLPQYDADVKASSQSDTTLYDKLSPRQSRSDCSSDILSISSHVENPHLAIYDNASLKNIPLSAKKDNDSERRRLDLLETGVNQSVRSSYPESALPSLPCVPASSINRSSADDQSNHRMTYPSKHTRRTKQWVVENNLYKSGRRPADLLHLGSIDEEEDIYASIGDIPAKYEEKEKYTAAKVNPCKTLQCELPEIVWENLHAESEITI